MYRSGTSSELSEPPGTTARRPSGRQDKGDGGLVRTIGKTATAHRRRRGWRPGRFLRPLAVSRPYQVYAALLLVLFVLSTLAGSLQPFLESKPYRLSEPARQLLPAPSDKLAALLKYDAKEQVFTYNDGYTGMVNPESAALTTGAPRITATFSPDPAKGMTVTDPLNKVDFTLKPKFPLLTGKQDGNQLLYRLGEGRGYLVYTAQITGVKEDIILDQYLKDRLEFEYELGLENGLEARLEANGSLGIYGSDLPLNGEVSTGSEADAALLEKARGKATKNKLLFSVPAPVVNESGKTASAVKTYFQLEGNTLKVVAEKLKDAAYPLSIDPSVYVETAQKFMRGNNETNIDFDVANELIQKGSTTGARIPSWTANSMALPATRWKHGTVVTGGYMYVVGGNTGASGSGNLSSVLWARIDPSNYTLTSPNPGSGACADWCTNTAYDLPSPRAGLALTAYNGFLYAIGGENASCSGGGICNTVYYAKIGANGEPISWNTTTVIPTERRNTGFIAYNNRLYVTGGQTNASANGVTTAQYADIRPDGTLGSWTATTALPSLRWGHNMLQYNGYLYLVGGNSGGTVQNTVHYIKVTSDGSLAGSWTATTAFSTARMTVGGTFATIWGGYMYIAGGCSVYSGPNCTTVENGIQLASLNADGTVTNWTDIGGVTQARLGYGLVAWRNTLYAVGGCSAAMSNGNCPGVDTQTAVTYGTINSDGDTSSIQTATTLPAAGNGANANGRMSMGVVLNNGFIYTVGGCTNNSCSAMSDNISYAPINADGSIGSWTTQDFRTGILNDQNGINAGSGLGAFGITVYNNRIYAVGGTSGASNGWTRSIFYADLDAAGGVNNTSRWSTATNQLPSVGNPGYGYSYVFARGASPTTGGLYIIGGCSAPSLAGVGCNNYRTEVLKCSISHSTGAPSGCATTNQLQIDADTVTGGNQGIGLVAGSVWGDFIYLAGGSRTGSGDANAQLDTVFWAKFNASGNIVRADNGSATGNWQLSANALPRVRRRSTAYAINGYLYVIGGHDGTTGSVATLNDIVYFKINVATGDIGSNTLSATTISQRWDLRLAAANGYLYILGGCTTGNPPDQCSGMSGINEYVQVYNNYSGSPAAYSTSTALGADRIGAGAAVYNGYIYSAGGCTNIGCTAFTNVAARAPINADGTIGAWGSAGSNMGTNRAWFKLLAHGGYLYAIGGQSGSAASTALATTEKASINTNGSLNAWGADTSLGAGNERSGHDAVIYNGYAYVTGGSNTAGTAQSTVYYSQINSGTGAFGAWNTATAFTTVRSGHVAVAYNGALYVIGGFDGTNYLLDTQYAKINANGTIGSWSYGTSLPLPVRQGSAFAANGYLYVLGGRSTASACTNSTYIAPFSANTTVASGNNPTGIGMWSQTNIAYNGNRYGHAAVYNEGRVYVLNGGCAAMVASGDRLYYGTLQSQPQIARFSYKIDADTDVFPTKWLANGLDNDIGARWLLNYRSSTTANNSWGQNTNFGDITLGTPGTYTPLDGVGANSKFARYYYLSITIDGSQAYGYPEDVTRGPTIADLSLFFTADPSKRLRHGKTFIDGQQQPLDTPF